MIKTLAAGILGIFIGLALAWWRMVPQPDRAQAAIMDEFREAYCAGKNVMAMAVLSRVAVRAGLGPQTYPIAVGCALAAKPAEPPADFTAQMNELKRAAKQRP